MITAIAIKFEILFFLITVIILFAMLCGGKIRDKLIAPAAVSAVCTYISHLMTYVG